MNIISANLIYFGFAAMIITFFALALFRKHLTPTFKYQLLLVEVLWPIALILQIQMSGCGVTPGMNGLICWPNSPLFNWYNINVPMTLFGVMYSQGFLVTNYMHAVAASIFVLTVDLFIQREDYWCQAAISSLVTTFLLNVWKVNEIINHFNGSPLDTQMDWMAQNVAIIITLLVLYWWNKRSSS